MSVISNVCCNGGTFEFKLKYPLHWGPRRQIGPDQARARARSSQTSQLLVLRGFNSGRGRGSASPVLSPRSALGSPRLRGFWVYVSEQRLETRGAGHHQSWLCKLLAINQTIKHKASAEQKWYSSDTRHDRLALWPGLCAQEYLDFGDIHRLPQFKHPQLHPLFVTIHNDPPPSARYWDVSRLKPQRQHLSAYLLGFSRTFICLMW